MRIESRFEQRKSERRSYVFRWRSYREQLNFDRGLGRHVDNNDERTFRRAGVSQRKFQ
jgi:hypothetical protein